MSIQPADQLSVVESAIHLKMSPELLDYFTRRSVKSGEKRKLAYTEKSGVRWYARVELDSYDKYLRAPWPKKPKAQRPHLPKRIREEIKLEAGGACPVCNHEIKGEAAHIEPVADTMSHHPENLIWLCPTHHSVVDDVAVAANVTMATIKVLKGVLVDRRLHKLGVERAATADFLWLIRQVEKISALLAEQSLGEAANGLNAIAKLDVAALEICAKKLAARKGAPVSEDMATPLKTLAESVAKSIKKADGTKPGGFAKVASEAKSARAKYLKDTGQVDCPICAGKGVRNGSDCTACGGEGALSEHGASMLDASAFDVVNCLVCKGKGRRKGDDCRACGGEGKLERGLRDHVDPSDYEDVDCPLCEGTGRRSHDDCPECHGDGQMEKREADQVDVSQYDDVNCPLCEERGKDPDCRICEGQYRIEDWRADQIDLSDYRMVNCKLCKGSGQFEREDCPGCGGAGDLERQVYDNIEWRQWDRVDCPKCDGKGHNKHDDCRYCDGEGTMFLVQKWNLD